MFSLTPSFDKKDEGQFWTHYVRPLGCLPGVDLDEHLYYGLISEHGRRCCYQMIPSLVGHEKCDLGLLMVHRFDHRYRMV